MLTIKRQIKTLLYIFRLLILSPHTFFHRNFAFFKISFLLRSMLDKVERKFEGRITERNSNGLLSVNLHRNFGFFKISFYLNDHASFGIIPYLSNQKRIYIVLYILSFSIRLFSIFKACIF
jgi:hypothetical protein